MNTTAQPRPTLDDLHGRATMPVWSDNPDDVSAAALLDISRSHAYLMARRGDFPIIQLGTRRIVPVPAFLRWLGAEPTSSRTLEDA